MSENSVIVTGGAGFIGSNIAEKLLRDQYKVTVIDNLSTGRYKNISHPMNNKNFRFIEGSILDENILQDAFKDAEYILHQAAIPSVQRSIDNPIASNDANITGTLKVLNAAKNASIKKVVIASSSSVYGDTPTLPKKETMVPNPQSPYAVSKLSCEHYCKVFYDLFGLETISLRYFNVFGPHQDPHSDYAAVIPKFISAIASGKPLTIFGDGTQTRDFTYVQNVVNANILAMKSKATGIYNVACGNRMALNELATILMSLIGKRVEINYTSPRAGDIKHSLADISLAKQNFGYVPEFDIKHGLAETVRWFLADERLE